jgi:hypothetical protein
MLSLPLGPVRCGRTCRLQETHLAQWHHGSVTDWISTTWRKYFDKGSLLLTVLAIVQWLAAAIAVVLSLLGGFGIIAFSTTLVRSAAIFIGGLILLALIAQAQQQADLQSSVQSTVRTLTDLHDEIHQVPPDEIGDSLNRLLAESTTWLFRGGSGRWLRMRTLPELSERTDRDVTVLIHLLDPRDEILCSEYARYRCGSRQPDDIRPGEEDPRTIQADILASIFAAGWYAAHSRVRAKIVLIRTYSPLRLDVGSTGLFVTIADKRSPGLYCSEASWYYNSIQDELNEAIHGHCEVNLPVREAFPVHQEDVTAEAVRACLAQTQVGGLGEPSGPLLSDYAGVPDDLDWAAIAKRVIPREEL